MKFHLSLMLLTITALLAAPRALRAQTSTESTSPEDAGSSTSSAPDEPEPDPRARAQADEHLRRGLVHYEEREFELAIVEFLAGYELHARPELLFALAQAERRSGDCASATVYYDRFLATSPSEKQVEAAQLQLAACRIALTTGPGTTPREEPTEMQPEIRVVAQQHTPWYHDWVGDSLAIAGTASLATGAVLLFKSRSAADRASWAETYATYDMELERARRDRLWGMATLATGAALVVGASYRFYKHGRERRAQTEDIGIVPSRDGLALSLSGSF